MNGYGTNNWLANLNALKDFWRSRYAEAENQKQRDLIRQKFSIALAEYYDGSKHTDVDIVEEVAMELADTPWSK